MDALDVLERQRRCVLALRGTTGPVVVPAPCWSDGAHLWLSPRTALLGGHDVRAGGGCALHVPGVDGGPAVAASGDTRAFGPGDPVGVLLHGPAIAGAMAALTATSASSVPGYVQDTAQLPLRLLLRDRIVVRVRLHELELVDSPARPPGIAPALPPAVPADVRRVIGGQRRVAVALDRPGLEILPGAIGAGFALTLPPGRSLPEGARVAVVIEEESSPPEVGLALCGPIGPGGVLRPERARWWDRGGTAGAEVPSTPAAGSGIVLPD